MRIGVARKPRVAASPKSAPQLLRPAPVPQLSPERPAADPAPLLTSLPGADLPAQRRMVLGMQRTSGNQAVVHLLRKSTGYLQRAPGDSVTEGDASGGSTTTDEPVGEPTAIRKIARDVGELKAQLGSDSLSEAIRSALDTNYTYAVLWQVGDKTAVTKNHAAFIKLLKDILSCRQIGEGNTSKYQWSGVKSALDGIAQTVKPLDISSPDLWLGATYAQGQFLQKYKAAVALLEQIGKLNTSIDELQTAAFPSDKKSVDKARELFDALNINGQSDIGTLKSALQKLQEAVAYAQKLGAHEANEPKNRDDADGRLIRNQTQAEVKALLSASTIGPVKFVEIIFSASDKGDGFLAQFEVLGLERFLLHVHCLGDGSVSKTGPSPVHLKYLNSKGMTTKDVAQIDLRDAEIHARLIPDKDVIKGYRDAAKKT